MGYNFKESGENGLFEVLPAMRAPVRDMRGVEMDHRKIARRMKRSMKEVRLLEEGLDPFGYLMTRYANLDAGVEKDVFALILLRDILPKRPIGSDPNDVSGDDVVIRIGGGT